MKKLFVVSILFIMCFSGAAFAADLNGLANGLVTLSNGVEGNYFPNAATAATDYVMSTAHTQGNQVYASGSFTAAIWKRPVAASKYASSDLMTGPTGTSVDETIFSGASFTEI